MAEEVRPHPDEAKLEEAKRERDKVDRVIEMMREQVRIMREGQRVS